MTNPNACTFHEPCDICAIDPMICSRHRFHTTQDYVDWAEDRIKFLETEVARLVKLFEIR